MVLSFYMHFFKIHKRILWKKSSDYLCSKVWKIKGTTMPIAKMLNILFEFINKQFTNFKRCKSCCLLIPILHLYVLRFDCHTGSCSIIVFYSKSIHEENEAIQMCLNYPSLIMPSRFRCLWLVTSGAKFSLAKQWISQCGLGLNLFY